MKWYEKSFRRHLCDMHINDTDPSYFSEYSPEGYVECLKAAKIDSPMIYLQSHVGLCYFPTKTGVMHKAFQDKPDVIKKTIELMHKEGMNVIGYYSLNFNNVEHDRHPEWRMIKETGLSRRESEDRYGLCCPNNMEYREFVFAQIKEMLEYFEVEGMFYDMPFWPHICYCENCQKRFKEETGLDMPRGIDTTTHVVKNETYHLLNKKMMEWMGEWAQAVTDYTLSLNPQLTIEQNFASAVSHEQWLACGDEVNDACDYTGGDLYGGFYEQSYVCKYYYNQTKNRPFEYMTCRCNPNLSKHTITKSHDQLKLAVMLTCAHHGATLLIDAIDPVGTMDMRVYKMMGDIFSEEEQYEKYLSGSLLSDVGIYSGISSKFNEFDSEISHHTGSVGAVKKLATSHIPQSVITNYQLSELSNQKAIILSLVNHLKDEAYEAFYNYVNNGGILYFSGSDRRLLDMAGLRFKEYTKHNQVYIGATKGKEDIMCGFDLKYPMPFEMPLSVVEATDGEVIAKIVLPYSVRGEDNDNFSSIHSDPPGVITESPAVVIKSIGKGKLIWSAAPFEAMGPLPYKKVLLELLKYAGFEASIKTNAPQSVEIVSFKDENSIKISAVNITEEDEAPAIAGFNISVKCEKKPKEVLLLPEEKKIDFKYSNGEATFQTRNLHIFDMYELKF